MTDDRQNQQPDAERIIKAAATISGSPPGDLNLEQAIEILLNTDPETARAEILHRAAEVGAAAIFTDDMTDTEAASLEDAAQQIIDTIDYLKNLDRRERLLNGLLKKQIADRAAAALFDDPEQAAQWAAAAHEKAVKEATAETIAQAIKQEIEPVIKEGIKTLRDALDIVARGKPAAQCTKKQRQKIIEAAAFITGQETDADTAADVIRGILDSTDRDELNAALRQEGLKPIRAAEDQQQGETEPVKEKAADDPDDRGRVHVETDDDGRRVIRIDPPEYDPTLDPESPEFDPEKWKAYTAEASERLKETVARTQKTIAEAMQPALTSAALSGMMQEQARKMSEAITTPLQEMARAAISPAFAGVAEQIQEHNRILAEAMRSPAIEAIQEMTRQTQEMLQGLSKTIAPTIGAMQSYFNSDAWKSIRQTLAEIAEAAPAWLAIAEEITELTPYLEAELQKPEYEGKSIDELFDTAETDDDGNPIEKSLFMQALTAARAARDAAAAKEEPTHATIKRTDIVEYPLDKPNSIIWNLLEKDTRGQISFNMAKYGSKQQIPAYYAINFDDLGNDIQITKRLLPFDKRVYIAVSALFNAGNNVITLSQIYYAMGNTGRPSANQLQKINDAVTKMTTARIFFDNEQEAAKYKYNRFKYDGSLLPLERGTAIVNGQLADAAIHIFREPPLIAFAKQRNQITTVDVKLLQSPVSKTDANLLIDDYLIERISKAKNGKSRSCRILFKTLYDHTGIPDKPKTNTEKSAKRRAPEKIKKYLTHYQKQGFINNFTMQNDGITVYW